MTTVEKLLHIFVNHAETWVSGETIASNLHISRAAVWKAINKLTEAGFTIESQRGLGYRYIPSEKMTSTEIQHLLKSPMAIRVFDSLDSTNRYAKLALVDETLNGPLVVISNIQTHGVGHLGRSFFSPSQTGLYLSIALPLTFQDTVKPQLLTISTAVAVAKSMRTLFGVDLQYQWLNNLYYNQQKVGGILTEGIMTLESQTFSGLVVGIGLNLTPPHVDQPQKMGAITPELTLSRNAIAAQVIQDFFQMYQQYQSGIYLPDYRRQLMGLGETVTITQHDQTITGQILQITDDGYLQLQTPTGITTLTSGDRL